MTVQQQPIGSGDYGDNVIAGWFREIPVTMWICTFNVVTWVAAFFGHAWLLSLLIGQVSVSTAWKCVTYPLGGVGRFDQFAIMVVVFGMFAGSLERGWGSIKFARVCVVITLVSAFFNWIGFGLYLGNSEAAIELPFLVAGLPWLDIAIIVIWCGLYRNSSILFLFVIPMQAWVMAVIALVAAFFMSDHPILGAFVVITPILGWFWATSADGAGDPGASPSKSKKSLGDRIAEKKRSRQKSRFKLLEGGGQEPSEPVATLRRVTPEPPKEDTELDRILDKIRFEGMESLTDAERATLDQKSQSLRDD